MFRPAIPVFKYPFILLYFYLIIYSFIRYKGQIISSFTEFVKNYFLVLFLILIFLVSFILSNKLYLIIFKDAFNGIILLSIFFLLSLRIATRNDINRLIYLLLLLIIVFSIVISVNVLCRLLDIFPGGEVYPLTGKFAESATSAFEIDNNFRIDYEIMKLVGLSACPADAFTPVLELANIVTESKGGQGAFRDFAEILIHLNTK